jgi:hypothetical protein
MSDIRIQLGRWVTQELTEGIRMQYGPEVAADLSTILREYIATLRSDQMLMRMAANIRNRQIEIQKLIDSASFQPVSDNDEVI